MLRFMGKTFFDQSLKNDLITYKNIRKFATGQGDDYATGCLLDYNYFKNGYKNDSNRFKQTARA